MLTADQPQVVSAYLSLRIDITQPSLPPDLTPACEALLALGLLRQSNQGDGTAEGLTGASLQAGASSSHGSNSSSLTWDTQEGDPVSWPALHAWTHIAESVHGAQNTL